MKDKNVIKQIDLINKQFNENKNSHVFLIKTNNKEKCLKDVKDIIKTALNADEVTSKQIDMETYIELTVIRNENKEILIDKIKYLLEKIKIKPILSDHVFYIINDAESLSVKSSNKLLKTIEEPNEEIVGFLITNNISKIIPTVKSRCQLFEFNYDESNFIYDDSIITEGKTLLTGLETLSLLDYNLYKNNNKNLDENYRDILNYMIKYYNKLIISGDENSELEKIIKSKNSDIVLLKKCKYLNKLYDMINSNMNKDLLLEKIYIDFRMMEV